MSKHSAGSQTKAAAVAGDSNFIPLNYSQQRSGESAVEEEHKESAGEEEEEEEVEASQGWGGIEAEPSAVVAHGSGSLQ